MHLGEGFVYIDLDHVRDPQTGEVQAWALELIEFLNTYTEISASGAGFHLVARGSLPEDFKIETNPVEIYSGHIPNKLMALTGNTHELYVSIETRQVQLVQILKRAQGGEFGRGKSQPQRQSQEGKSRALARCFPPGVSNWIPRRAKFLSKGFWKKASRFWGAQRRRKNVDWIGHITCVIQRPAAFRTLPGSASRTCALSGARNGRQQVPRTHGQNEDFTGWRFLLSNHPRWGVQSG